MLRHANAHGEDVQQVQWSLNEIRNGAGRLYAWKQYLGLRAQVFDRKLEGPKVNFERSKKVLGCLDR